MFAIFPFACFLMGVFFLGTGGAVLTKKKPLVLSSRWFFICMALIFVPLMAESIILLVRLFGRDTTYDGNIGMVFLANIGRIWMMLLTLLMWSVLIAVSWIQSQGYMLLGITDQTARGALHFGLQELGTPYEETLTKIKLPELDTELQVSVHPWMGTGQIKIKHRSQKAFLAKLVVQIRRYFKDHDVPTENVAAIFHLIAGGFMILLPIGTFLEKINMNFDFL